MVRGGSWLYNIEAYRRLFPPEYGQTAQPVDDEFRFLAQPASRSFLACLEQQTTVAGLKQCFPLHVLQPACAIYYFYRFYERY